MKKAMKETLDSVIVAAWFMFLTFPIMVIKVNTIERTISWRWMNMVYVGLGAFILSFLWRFNSRRKPKQEDRTSKLSDRFDAIFKTDKQTLRIMIMLLAGIALAFPFFMSGYQISIITTALMYVVLGLGLNIEVGLAGLLDLGYVAFYAVGAYTYALLNFHYGISFWLALPIGALLSASTGIMLGFPVLRLKGDYLAIVTLGFAEIIRLVLNNWSEFSMGPSGIANISQPGLFGIRLTLEQENDFLYYIMLALVLVTVFVVGRLRDSRIGRAWMALREDEIACQAMGVDKTKAKLTAFAIGATWAGMMGCVFAAKTTFVNPASFTFWESILILSIVVLGGMGSIIGIVIAAFILILLPEYLQSLSQVRMLIFGAAMVLMMVFRPQGLVSRFGRKYRLNGET